MPYRSLPLFKAESGLRCRPASRLEGAMENLGGTVRQDVGSLSGT